MVATSPGSNSDFTDRVMSGVKARPRKIGLWNLIYVVPIALAVLLLANPGTRIQMVNIVNPDHAAVESVQQEVNSMQSIIDDLEVFDDETLSQVEYTANGQ